MRGRMFSRILRKRYTERYTTLCGQRNKHMLNTDFNRAKTNIKYILWIIDKPKECSGKYMKNLGTKFFSTGNHHSTNRKDSSTCILGNRTKLCPIYRSNTSCRNINVLLGVFLRKTPYIDEPKYVTNYLFGVDEQQFTRFSQNTHTDNIFFDDSSKHSCFSSISLIKQLERI